MAWSDAGRWRHRYAWHAPPHLIIRLFMTFASGVITVALRNYRYDVITIFVLLLHAIKRARKSFVRCREATLQFDTLSHLISCQKLSFHYRVYLSFFLFWLAIKREKRNTAFCRKPILQFNTLSYLVSC